MTATYALISVSVLALATTLFSGCGGSDEKRGATASLSWTPVIDGSSVSYTVHFGKNSSGQVGSCSYEHSVNVSQPFADIGGLDFNTQYYFAVSAFNENGRSQCSNEASKLTPDAPPVEIGDPPVRVA
jgi:Fibronectin type III domain